MSPLDPISGNSLPDIGPQGICDGLRNPTYMLYIYVAGIRNIIKIIFICSLNC